ncbi:MAG: Zn-dependent exopeptidase M28 [Christensenellaceae bacterium]|jgi:uncharacterized membrane protein|nr:Zn-dependent exopeptidase M28 [Christensenellaceae bacterium]
MKDTKEYADYSEKEIKYVCTNFKARSAGSKTEVAASEYLKGEIEKGGWADKVETQKFRVQPHSLMLFTKIIPFIMATGGALFFINPIITLGCTALCFFILISTLIFYWQIFDFLLPRRTSQNLVATRSATGETKRRIIFGGHVDAAYEWQLFRGLGNIGFKLVSFIAIFSMLFATVISVVIIAGVDYHWWMNIPLGTLILSHVFILFFNNYHEVVDGANDNMTGTMIAISVLKYMHENKISYENTEVIALVTGGEEAGLRGAKAYARRNKDFLRDKNIETVFIAIETIRDFHYFKICDRDLNGLVRADRRAVKLLDTASERLYGTALPHIAIVPGASDAAALQQAKIPSVCLSGMDPRPSKYYHTRYDNANNLDVHSIQRGIEICLKSLEVFNESGLGS